MPISLTLLQTAKDLLLFGPLDIGIEAAITSEWDQQLAALCREYDLFTTVTTLPATVNKSIYSVPIGTVRIFSVLYNGRTLGYADRANLDLANEDWELVAPGIPTRWSYNALAGDVDSPAVTITPREFLITPAPDGANAGASAITLIAQNVPATVPVWIEPILLYRTVAHIAAENPNCVQPEKGQWFNQLADFWLESSRRLMQV